MDHELEREAMKRSQPHGLGRAVRRGSWAGGGPLRAAASPVNSLPHHGLGVRGGGGDLKDSARLA